MPRTPQVRLIGPPEADGEYVELLQGGRREIVHLHDYRRIYDYPGLYERVVGDLLDCRSPQVAAAGLERSLTALALDPATLTALDLGAGTGLVGELVRDLGVANVVGIDALAAAREACVRDRPEIYLDYLVGDLATPSPLLLDRLRAAGFGALVSAGAFGGTHATPAALLNALPLLAPHAPVVFTIDERWMQSSAGGGFGGVVSGLLHSGELQLLERSRFRHRLTTSGDPVAYELVVAAKDAADARAG